MVTDEKKIRLVLDAGGVSSKIGELEAKLASLKKKKDEALALNPKANTKEFDRQIKSTELGLRNVETRAKAIERAIASADKATPKQLQRTIKEINSALNSGAVERNSEEWKTLQTQLGLCRDELRKIKDEGKAASTAMEQVGQSGSDRLATFGQKWAGFSYIFTQARGAISSLAATAGEYVNKYAAIAEHMNGVEKYTGLAKDEVEELNAAFQKMDTRTSRAALNDLAADAGRLGIQSKEAVLDFVDAANQINVALGEDLGEGAVRNIGKLADLFGDSNKMGLKQAMLATASTINDLAQSSSANEGYIMDFTARLSGMAVQAGLTQAQVMGLAAVMDQSMVNAEEGSTAFSRLIQKLYKEPAELAQAVGLNVKQFTKLVKEDANAALLEFATAAQKLGGMDALAPKLGDLQLTGAGVTKVITSLANQVDKVRETQEQATAAFADATSVTDEYAKANSTVEATLEKARQRQDDAAATLGEALTPAYISLLNATTGVSGSLAALVSYLSKNASMLTALATAVAVATIACKAHTIQLSIWYAKELLLQGALKAKAAVIMSLQVLMAPFRLAIGLVSVAITAMTQGTRAATVAMRALKIAMASTPWGAVALAVSALAAGLFTLMSKEKSLTDEQKRANNEMERRKQLMAQVAQNASEEIAKVTRLNAIIHDNARSYDARRAAINELKKIIPNYHAELTHEGRLVRENISAYNEYIRKIQDAAMEQAIQAKMGGIAADKLEADLGAASYGNDMARTEAQLNHYRSKYSGIDFGRYVKTDRYGKRSVSINFSQETALKEWLNGLGKKNDYAISAVKGYIEVLDRRDAIQKALMDKERESDALQAEMDKVAKQSKSSVSSAGADSGASAATTASTSTKKGETGAHKGDARAAAASSIKKQAEADITEARALYDLGVTSYKEYTSTVQAIEDKSVADRLALYKTGEAAHTALIAEQAETRRKHEAANRAYSLKQIDIETDDLVRAENAAYARGEGTAETHEAKLNDIKLAALQRRLDYMKLYGANEEDLRAAQNALEDEDTRQTTARRERTMAAYNDFVKKYAGTGKETAQRATLEELLQQADDFAASLGLDADAVARLKEQIKANFGKDGSAKLDLPADAFVQSVVTMGEALHNLSERVKDGNASWTDYARTACAALTLVQATTQGLSSYVQAAAEAEAAKVTARYDAEIEAAGSSSTKGKKLEKEKEKELSKLKKKAAKQSLAINIASATAATAQNAIMAYGAVLQPAAPWTVPLAVIASAAAVASGMLQIATMRKQYEAQVAGYYDGGFTGGRRYRREAGVVHEGEFVANHLAVENPALMPVLSLIDHAQRTNSVASLTAADVSRAIASPGYAPSSLSSSTASAQTAAPIVVQQHDPATTAALERLNATLDAGITATASIDGPNGIARQLRRYNKLNASK